MSTLHSALRAMSDAELRALIAARPDATFPTPATLASLATRLTLPGSIARALRDLSAADIAVLEAAGDLGAEIEPITLEQLQQLPFDAAPSVDTLRRLALVFGPDDALHITPGVLSVLPPGWRIMDPAPEDLTTALDSISTRERQVLDTLAASGSVGTTRGASPEADPIKPVPHLISLGLLARVNSNTVRLPRPVREALRGTSPRVYPLKPRTPKATIEQESVDTAAAVAGLDMVRQMRQLLTLLITEPVTLNRDSSVGVRALGALTKTLGFDPTLVITVSESTGVLGRGDIEAEVGVLAATRDGLGWMDAVLSDQWAMLLAGWVASPWRTEREDKLLSTEMHAPEVRVSRMTILRQFLSGPLTIEDLLADVHFNAPLLAAGMSQQLIDAVTREGHLLGAIAKNTASTPLRTLLDRGDIAATTKALVPPEVNYLIAQADMTILAPGPLTPGMASVIESFTQLESPGLASVYRVTTASVRRALDSGRTAEELHQWLAQHCVGEVPQAITFLIDDVARHHGALRAGAIASYIRSEDPALIASVASKVASISMLAPTVAVSPLPLAQLLAQLRAGGFQPIAEDSSGATLNLAPEPFLAPPTPSTLPRERTLDPDHTEAVLTTLRTSIESDGDDEDAGGEASVLSTLQAAARARRHVTIGYVDKNGTGTQLTVLPLSVTAGQVDALDEAADAVVRVALPRITKVILT